MIRPSCDTGWVSCTSDLRKCQDQFSDFRHRAPLADACLCYADAARRWELPWSEFRRGGGQDFGVASPAAFAVLVGRSAMTSRRDFLKGMATTGAATAL